MSWEGARAGKNNQGKGMQMAKVKHLWQKEIWLQERCGKAVTKGVEQ